MCSLCGHMFFVGFFDMFLTLGLYILGEESLGHVGNSAFNFKELPKLFYTEIKPFLPAMRFLISSTSLPTLTIFLFVYYSYPIRCELVSHCGFDLHYSNDQC